MRKVEAGILAGLEAGPLLSYPVTDCLITIHGLSIARATQEPMILAGSSNLVRQLLTKATVRLAEPVMMVEVTTGEDMVGTVVQDFINRRGNVLGTEGMGEVRYLIFMELFCQKKTKITISCQSCVVRGEVPLAELRGYSSEVRTVTRGTASISMMFSHYQVMSQHHQDTALQELAGF